MRMTFDFTDNEHKMSDYLTDKAAEHRQGDEAARDQASRRATATTTSCRTRRTHNTGGAIMGANPTTSVVNRYLQSWDVPNLFVMGASAFPQNAGYNPTGTVGALTYWAADAIKKQYLKKPGPLVQA